MKNRLAAKSVGLIVATTFWCLSAGNGQVSLGLGTQNGQAKKPKKTEPEREEIVRSYELLPGARVDISNIRGPVEIETVDGNIAQVSVLRTALRREDFARRRMIIDRTPSGLVVRSDGEKQNEMGGNRATDRVKLVLPRRIDLKIEGITGDVKVQETDGEVRVNGVSGTVEIAGAQGITEIRSIVGDVKATVRGIDRRGMVVESIVGMVELTFTSHVDADLSVSSVTGGIFPKMNNLVTRGYPNIATLEGRIGSGGATIKVSTVVGSVTLSSK